MFVYVREREKTKMAYSNSRAIFTDTASLKYIAEWDETSAEAE